MTSVKDLDRTFNTMRNVALLSVLSTFIVALVAGLLVFRAYESSGQRVYVVGNNGSFSALSTSHDTHTRFEARNLVSTFMTTMYGHDQYTYKAHLDAALPLIEDRGGRRIYEGFKTGQVFENYVRYGARATITVDSIRLDMSNHPYTGQVYVKQRILIGDQMSKSQPLAAKFALVETDRSDANPYGMLITDFDYIAYNPAQTEEEKNELKQQETDRQRKLAAAAQAAGTTLSPSTPSK
jgi:hypothetical protein